MTSMPEKKTDIVRRLVSDGNYKKALSIVKGFRLGIRKEDLVSIQRGYECLIYPDFYRQMEVDVDATVDLAINTMLKLYGKTKAKGQGEHK